jgi:hypothetical protein
MPTLAELAQMSDASNSGAYVGYPQLQRQAAKMRLAQMGRIPENLPDPKTYGFVSGLLGTSPDQLGMSVLSPNTAPAKEAAYMGYQLSNLGQIAPAMMPAAKAGLRTAGNAINDAMVYGTGPLARITPQPMRLTTYHGTPHSFDKFDASKIGTGEGAQAYGHGIYVAENPEVARGYANRLGANLIMVDGKPMDFNNPVHIAASIISDPNNAGLPGERLASAIRYNPKGIVPFGAESKVEEIAKALESGKLPKFTNEKGNFYKVDLPDEHIEKMLDWDKPLSQQSDFVKQAFKYQPPELPKDLKVTLTGQSNPNWKYSVGGFPAAPTEEKAIENALKSMKSSTDYTGKTGQELYKEVASTFANSKNPLAYKEASDELNKLGITGIKYLDEGSRGAKDGTRNFVVFPGNEHLLKILSKNEKLTK